ncbi:MAG: VWA domain-containing protein [Phycisphaeraceae bacterium]
MGFLSPIVALIAAGITVPLLVSLYFLKLRRRQVVISSTLLWKRTIQDMQVNSPFQKLRKNLLLLLQLLILAGLLLAFARPTLRSAAIPGQRIVIAIDHSASMNATDVSPTRLDQARNAALGLIEDLEGSAMVVSFAGRAKVVQSATSDRSLLRAAIRSIEPTDETTGLRSALQLVEPFALEGAADGPDQAKSLVVYVLSDGRVRPGDAATDQLALRGAKLNFVQIGNTDKDDGPDNLAIVSLSARRDFKKPQRVQVFTALANYGPNAVRTNLTLRLDGRVQRVVPVTVPPAAAGMGEAASQSVQFDLVLTGAALLALSHDHTDDLPADDTARLTVAPPRRLRVLLVTGGNAFLERVIDSIGVRRLVLMTPKKFEDQDPTMLRRGGWDDAAGGEVTGFDVIVFDAYSPKAAPLVNSLYLGAAPPIENLQLLPPTADAPKAQVLLNWQRDHPLLRYVALDDLVISEPGRLALPDTAVTLATGQAGPVMAAVAVEGVRHVVSSFDILNSNWPMHISFPVFLNNAVHWLGLGGQSEAGLSYRPGQVAVVPVTGAIEQLTYRGPAPLSALVRGGRAVLPAFRRVGVYECEQEVDPPWDRLTVNLLDPIESDLRPADQLEVGTATAAAISKSASVRREVWHWFIWAALAVMMIEWLVYTRRMHL